MSEVLSLEAGRAARSARTRADIEKLVAESTAHLTAYIEWLGLPAETRANVADFLAQEIAIRYKPIALQFRNALYDALLLHLAAGMELDEDPGLALAKGLGLMLGCDQRFIAITAHIIRETSIKKLPVEAHASFRASMPSPVDQVRADLVIGWEGLRKS